MREIALFSIWDRPLIFYLGILAIVLVLLTAYIGRFRPRIGRKRLGVKQHRVFAYVALGVALVHGILAVSVYIR